MTWVYDGDTMAVDDGESAVEVRLVDLNAPEKDECFHEESTRFLRESVDGEQVRLEVVGRDQFGRHLANVFLGERHVNREAVAMGFAVATTPSSGPGLIAEEETAVKQSSGLWSPDSCGSGAIPALDIEVDPQGERVTITNDRAAAISLGHWTIRDESSRHRYEFDGGAQIEPGAAIVVRSTDPSWQPGGSNVWNDDGDMALLLDREGRVVSRYRYKP